MPNQTRPTKSLHERSKQLTDDTHPKLSFAKKVAKTMSKEATEIATNKLVYTMKTQSKCNIPEK
jgi:hypothetical protein